MRYLITLHSLTKKHSLSSNLCYTEMLSLSGWPGPWMSKLVNFMLTTSLTALRYGILAE